MTAGSYRINNPSEYPVFKDSIALVGGLWWQFYGQGCKVHVRHINTSNIGFADGHVLALKYRDFWENDGGKKWGSSFVPQFEPLYP
jgi:prepilin-type processing-associated H-X9-DG protein